MRAHPILNLFQHLFQEAIRILGLPAWRGYNLIHETSAHKLFTCDPLALDKRFIGLRNSEALDKRCGSTTLGDKTK